MRNVVILALLAFWIAGCGPKDAKPPDGSLLGTLYHTTKGTPTYFDYYDDQKRVRRTLLSRPNGIAHTSREFDEQHILVIESRFDEKGETTGVTFYLQAGRVVLRSPPAWQVIAHKLDASRDVLGFQIPNPADEGTPDSATFRDMQAETPYEILAVRVGALLAAW
jgi:hypothetical protein